MTRNENSARRALKRLSTGLRINSAADEPSSHAMARGHFQNRLGRIQASIENLEMAASFGQLRWDALYNTQEKLYQLQDLLVRAANEATLTAADRAIIQTEIDGIIEAVDQNRNITWRSGDKRPGGSHVMFNPGMLDVVWVFDGTGSMNAYHAAAAGYAATMFAGFEAKGFDLNMAAVGFEGPTLGAYPVPAGGVILGGPVNSVLQTNGWTLTDNAGAFAAQAGACALPGGDETGMDALVEAAIAFANPGNPNGFREDAQRVFLLVTDADSDDQGSGGGVYPANDVDVDASIEQQAIDALNAEDIMMIYIGNRDELTGPAGSGMTFDQDYANVAVGTGGKYIHLDNYKPGPLTSNWVTEVTTELEALGGPWYARFHWGADSGDYLEYRFTTVVPHTLGIGGADATTQAAAQSSLSAMDGAFEILNNAITETGAFMGLIQRTINNQLSEYTQLASMTGNLIDADIAEEVTNFARATILQNAAAASFTHALQGTENLVSLISGNLSAKAWSGVAVDTASAEKD